jgi:hypothetical protein
MTTVTITDRSLLLDGHAGNRDVCISLSALSQLTADAIGRDESREPGRHEIHYTSHAVIIAPELIDALSGIIAQLEQQYPENVRLIDAR